eukprot:TRINITY_DN70744_c0_g1_i1.p1 TRINITY_DN70744_c0_g1~~TRINITY_DN70744_c0_g1_i1.p1  ORF type:complete len:285 (+),score=89.69 TRINITY_DN70744_c0_g1_i1:91-855(+)
MARARCVCCVAAAAVAFPYVVLIWAFAVHDFTPAAVQGVFSDAFRSGVQGAFGLQSVLIDNAADWGGKGPAAAVLPSTVCGAYFMKGNPADDGVADMTWGEWDAETRTLTMPLWHPRVWSWNDDFGGVRLFYGAWALRMKYVFHFNESLTSASIDSPILGGLVNFTSLGFGSGSRFLMNRVEPDGTVWVRKSYKADGSQAFKDYHPTRVARCKGGAVPGGLLADALRTVKDHPSYDRARSAQSGGATRRQLLRM